MLGVAFRVTHLDRKVYWHDEVFTSVRAVGYTSEEIAPQVFSGVPLAPDALLQYQRISPDRGWKDTWHALTNNPEHPPLYYLLVRLWMERFGSTIAVVRSVSVLFSLLAFPALYWLCRELFDRPAVGWVALALFALSPFHVLYAQEARENSLWTLATLLSSAALLRAMRLQTKASWVIYAVTVTLNLYTFLLSGMVLLGHGIFVLAMRPFSWRSLRRFTLAIVAGLLAFAPWLAVLVQNWLTMRSKTHWMTISPPRSFLTKLWGLHFSSDFVDLGLPLDHLYTYIAPPVVLALLGWALWVLCRHAPYRTWLFVLLLVALPEVCLILPDLIWGGARSSHTRYFVPMLLGAQLAVAYLLTYLIEHASAWQRQAGRGLLAALLLVGVVSCGISWQATTWWNKGDSYANASIAAFLNRLQQPLVISSMGDTTLGNAISLSHLVHDGVRFQLVKDPRVPQVPKQGDRFLFFASPTLVQGLQTTYSFTLEPIEQDGMPLLQRLVNP
jgi:uncharacterized membrane protein